jgi:hypothetical protein
MYAYYQCTANTYSVKKIKFQNLKMIYISNLNENLIILYFKLAHLNEIEVWTVTI